MEAIARKAHWPEVAASSLVHSRRFYVFLLWWQATRSATKGELAWWLAACARRSVSRSQQLPLCRELWTVLLLVQTDTRCRGWIDDRQTSTCWHPANLFPHAKCAVDVELFRNNVQVYLLESTLIRLNVCKRYKLQVASYLCRGIHAPRWVILCFLSPPPEVEKEPFPLSFNLFKVYSKKAPGPVYPGWASWLPGELSAVVRRFQFNYSLQIENMSRFLK